MARHITDNEKSTQLLAEAGSDNSTWMSPLRTAEAINEQVPTYNFSSDDFAVDGSNNMTTKKGSILSTGDILFDRNRIYGTVSTPLTGNITANYSGALVGSTAIIIHEEGSAPSFPSEFIAESGSGSYDTTAGYLNVITCRYISSEIVVYNISSISLTPIDTTMAIHFQFEEGSGSSVLDSSTYGNNGTIVNSADAAWVSGPIGNAIDIGNDASNGSRSYITIPTSASMQGVTTDFTVAFWQKQDVSGSEDWFLTLDTGSGTSPGIQINSIGDGRVECYINPEIDGYVAGSRVRTTATVTTATYTHWCFTYDGTTLQAYVDGVAENSTAIAGKNIGNSLTWYIGTDNGTSVSEDLNFDDFRVYDRALNGTEVGDLYALGS